MPILQCCAELVYSTICENKLKFSIDLSVHLRNAGLMDWPKP